MINPKQLKQQLQSMVLIDGALFREGSIAEVATERATRLLVDPI